MTSGYIFNLADFYKINARMTATGDLKKTQEWVCSLVIKILRYQYFIPHYNDLILDTNSWLRLPADVCRGPDWWWLQLHTWKIMIKFLATNFAPRPSTATAIADIRGVNQWVGFLSLCISFMHSSLWMHFYHSNK